MSGLNPLEHTILEFACVLSDLKLTQFVDGPQMVIHCPEEHLQNMDAWNTKYACSKQTS
jgi:oligoribonuclease